MKRFAYAALIAFVAAFALPAFAEDENPPAATEDSSATATDTAASDTTATEGTDTTAATDPAPADTDSK
jgi:hypothetical protein